MIEMNTTLPSSPMAQDPLFNALIQEGLSQELTGWDFSWLARRTRESPLPWDYRRLVLDRLAGIEALLDLGTGGGELLASLAPLPPDTCATEGYLPNVSVARRRLEPLGVRVADVSELGDRLPFEAASFDLVIDRHNGCDAGEVYRVLRPGGRYLTQQVGGENCMDLNRFLQDELYYAYGDMSLAGDVRRLEAAGFRILDQRQAFPGLAFLDIAAVVFYLTAIPWQIEGFSVEKYRGKLFQMHRIIQSEGEFVVKEHRTLVEAEK